MDRGGYTLLQDSITSRVVATFPQHHSPLHYPCISVHVESVLILPPSYFTLSEHLPQRAKSILWLLSQSSMAHTCTVCMCIVVSTYL